MIVTIAEVPLTVSSFFFTSTIVKVKVPFESGASKSDLTKSLAVLLFKPDLIVGLSLDITALETSA